ncbi:MAG: type I DNA topoisomerase [Patescibacteria group bacterium]|nr:type I DNA topoisomerase [Patescibacteria group bacterium]
MSKNLVIVESPTKAKTISRFLGDDFKVMSSYGHIRDLPQKKMGVDTEHNFEPQYVIVPKAKKNVDDLKLAAKNAGKIYFATDEDREGEAIAWHLNYILTADGKKKIPTERIVFHEITEGAIKNALEHPRAIDLNLVDAQQARRILDRLVGYELSPFLWKKVAKGLSAGRVQSVAVRLIIEREREIKKFKAEEYWTVDVQLAVNNKQLINNNQQPTTFTARLFKIDGKSLEKLFIKNKEQAEEILKKLEKGKYEVVSVEQKETKRNPLPPFTTSTLQQEASRKLGFSAKETMMVAQQLYEGVETPEHGQIGLITYMRTDSLNLAENFLNDARAFIAEKFGKDYVPATPNFYKNKSKGAQEAHEAVRPTHPDITPEAAKKSLTPKQQKLYALIWRRALASQTNPAIFDSVTADIKNENYLFRAVGSTIKFDGFLKIYNEVPEGNQLPPLNTGENLLLKEVKPEQHFTEPPARYADASLIKKLEELGIGRPSTYAPTISTIIDRGYVAREDKKFVPQDIAYIVNDLLVEHFPQVVDYDFTASMEGELDAVASGELKWQPVIKAFYQPFKENLLLKTKEIKKSDLVNEATDEKCEKCGSPMIIKTGRYGKFLACSAFPKCRNLKPIAKTEAPLSAEMSEALADKEKCPNCGKELVLKQSRFGKFLACSGYPDCKYIKNSFSTGVECPSCHQGKIMMRKTKTRRVFYGCSNYPNCNFALWSRPTGDKCPKCQALLVETGKNIKCSNKECDYIK